MIEVVRQNYSDFPIATNRIGAMGKLKNPKS